MHDHGATRSVMVVSHEVDPMQDSNPHRRHAPSSRGRATARSASHARVGAVRVGTVAVRAVDHLIDVGVSAGIRRDILTAAAGVTDADLHDPDARVPLTAEIALWQTLARYISDPEFGVQAGAAHPLRTMGLLGYVARFSATLRGALRRVQRYGRAFTEAVELELQEGRRELVLAKAHPALGPGHELAESYRIAALLKVSRELTCVDIMPAEVTFTYPQPPRTVAYVRFFRCPLRFGARAAGIVFRKPDLDLPVEGADETLAGYLSKYAEQVLASLVQDETMRCKVRAAIWSLLCDGPPSLSQVAGALRMSARTLERRLAAEGTSLQREIDEMRRTMAIAVLRDRSMGIEDVAFLLGYSEPSTFFRSFKRWTGTTPRRFRDRAV
jgi:AraC-like DNA-binding protein